MALHGTAVDFDYDTIFIIVSYGCFVMKMYCEEEEMLTQAHRDFHSPNFMCCSWLDQGRMHGRREARV